MAPWSGIKGSKFTFESRDDPAGVRAVDLFEDVRGESDSIDSPIPLRRRRLFRVMKVFVVGFQESPIDEQTFLRKRAVGAEQDPILILFEEVFGRIGLGARVR